MLPMFHDWAAERVSSQQIVRWGRALAIATVWALTVLMWISIAKAGQLLYLKDIDSILWLAAANAFRLCRVQHDAEIARAEDDARRRRLALAAADDSDVPTFRAIDPGDVVRWGAPARPDPRQDTGTKLREW